MQFDPQTILIIAATFLLAGTVKGVIGLGLPTVSLGILTLMIDLPSAMALIVVPGLATNIWQAMSGGNGRMLIKRLWPFLLTAGVGIWPGALMLGYADLTLLTGLLGILLVLYAASALFGLKFSFEGRSDRMAAPLFGLSNGVLTGMTGSFMIPGVLYLQALGLDRHAFVQAMGMLFMISTAGLALSLGGTGLMNLDQGLISALGLVPSLIGMALGQRLRRNLSEARFRLLFYTGTFLLGVAIAVQAFR